MKNGKEILSSTFESFLLDTSRSGKDCASDTLRSFESCATAKDVVLKHTGQIISRLALSLREIELNDEYTGECVETIGMTVRAILCLIRETNEDNIKDCDAIASVVGNIFLRGNLPADVILNVVLCLLYDAKRRSKMEIILQEVRSIE